MKGVCAGKTPFSVHPGATARALTDRGAAQRASAHPPSGPRSGPAPRRTGPATAAAGHLSLPIDLAPDFIPVLGYADDAIIVALTLRSIVKHAGDQAVRAETSSASCDLH
jgi:hypothetical protein